jgi:hypothetical protein
MSDIHKRRVLVVGASSKIAQHFMQACSEESDIHAIADVKQMRSLLSDGVTSVRRSQSGYLPT